MRAIRAEARRLVRVTPTDPVTIDWPPRSPRSPRRRRRVLLALLIVAGVVLFGGERDPVVLRRCTVVRLARLLDRRVLDVHRHRERVFAGFAVATFLVLYGACLLRSPRAMADLRAIIINSRTHAAAARAGAARGCCGVVAVRRSDRRSRNDG